MIGKHVIATVRNADDSVRGVAHGLVTYETETTIGITPYPITHGEEIFVALKTDIHHIQDDEILGEPQLTEK